SLCRRAQPNRGFPDIRRFSMCWKRWIAWQHDRSPLWAITFSIISNARTSPHRERANASVSGGICAPPCRRRTRQWQVRARSFGAFVRHIVRPMTRAHGRQLDILDLGAGNGWLCYRVARMGHKATALDLRTDNIDGLGAANEFLRDAPHLFERIVAPFDEIPLDANRFDIAIFN